MGSTGVMGALGRAQIDGTDGSFLQTTNTTGKREAGSGGGASVGKNTEGVERGRRGEVGLISGASRVEDVKGRALEGISGGSGGDRRNELRGRSEGGEVRERAGEGEGRRIIKEDDRGVIGLLRRVWRGER